MTDFWGASPDTPDTDAGVPGLHITLSPSTRRNPNDARSVLESYIKSTKKAKPKSKAAPRHKAHKAPKPKKPKAKKPASSPALTGLPTSGSSAKPLAVHTLHLTVRATHVATPAINGVAGITTRRPRNI